MPQRLATPVVWLFVVLLLATACGGPVDGDTAPTGTSLPATDTPEPTATPVPPTETPAPTETPLPPTDTPLPPTATPLPPTDTPPPSPTPAAGLPLIEEPFRNAVAGYDLRYPQGWQHESAEGVEGEIFFQGGVPLDELMANDTLPEWPVIMVLAGDPETVYYGTFDEAESAADVVQMLAARSLDDQATLGAVETVTLGGETGATLQADWGEGDMALTTHYLAVYLGDRLLAIQAAGTSESWAAFEPTFGAMLDSLTLFEPGQDQEGGGVYVDSSGRYALELPPGWQRLSTEGMEILYANAAVLDEIMNNEMPSIPAITLSAGPLDTVSFGEVQGAQDAEQMVEALLAARSSEGEDFQSSSIKTTAIGGAPAATAGMTWTTDGQRYTGNVLAVYVDGWGLVVHAAGADENWDGFLPVYIEVLNSIRLLEE